MAETKRFTQRHYIVIAGALKSIMNSAMPYGGTHLSNNDIRNLAVNDVTKTLSKIFAEDNSNFKPELFAEAVFGNR